MQFQLRNQLTIVNRVDERIKVIEERQTSDAHDPTMNGRLVNVEQSCRLLIEQASELQQESRAMEQVLTGQIDDRIEALNETLKKNE